MSDVNDINLLPVDVQLVIERLDRQVKFAEESKYHGRVELTMTHREYEILRNRILPKD